MSENLDVVVGKYVRAIEVLRVVEETALDSGKPIQNTSYIELFPASSGVPSRGLHIDIVGLALREVYKLRDGVDLSFDAQYLLIEDPNAINIRVETVGNAPIKDRVEAIGDIRETLQGAMRFLKRRDPWQRL